MICPKCKDPSGPIPPSRLAKSDYTCRRCHAQAVKDCYHRNGRKRYPANLTPEARKRANLKAYLRRSADPVQREKIRIRGKLQYAIKIGKILKQPCEMCGVPQVDAHHDDYSKPLDVRWLCRPHHIEFHKSVART